MKQTRFNAKSVKVEELHGVVMVNGVAVREVTNPIKCADIATPIVVPIGARTWLVLGHTSEQIAELEAMGGKYTPAYRGGLGVTFKASEKTKSLLHQWQNNYTIKRRAEILGKDWQLCDWLNGYRVSEGEEIVCVDGTSGTVTETMAEGCVIKFRSHRDGKEYSTAGYFVKPRYEFQGQQRYKATTEVAEGITREVESSRNMYDFHYEVIYRYYKNGELMAIFHASGYLNEWDHINTLRPPFAGFFSNGLRAMEWPNIWQADRFMINEITNGHLMPYKH